MKAQIIRGVLSILGSKVLILFIGLIITPFLVRLLGSSLYGDYAFVLSVFAISMILVNAGIFDGIRKYIAENRTKNDWVENVVRYYLYLAIISSVTAAFLFLVISRAGIPEQYLGTDFTLYFYLVGGLIIGRQAYNVSRGGLMGLGLETHSEPLSILQKILFGVCGLYLAYIGYGVAGVLVGQLFAYIVVSAIAFTLLFQRINIRKLVTKVPETFPRGELLSFNGYSVILILLTASLYHVDILLLQPISGSEYAGYYKAALVVAQFLWFVPIALQTGLLHSSSTLWSIDRINDITSMASKATRYNLVLILLLAIGIAILSKDFVLLYFGSEFEPAVVPLLILLPGVVGFALARPILAIGQGKGEFRILIFVTSIAAIQNIVLNLILIPRYGIIGAAIATTMSYGSMGALHVFAARIIGFNPVGDLRLARLSVVVVLSFPIIYLSAHIIESSVVSLILVPPIGFVAYSLLIIKLNVVSYDEILEIYSLLPFPSNQI